MNTRARPGNFPLSLKQFYTRSLFLPFAVMLLGFLLFVIGRTVPTSQHWSLLARIGALLSAVGAIGFIPYTLFLVLAWPLLLSRQSGRTLGRLSWLVPPVIAIAAAIFFVVMSVIQDGPSPYESGTLFVWLAPVLVVGYGYVIIIHLARVIGTRAGWIRDPEQPAGGTATGEVQGRVSI